MPPGREEQEFKVVVQRDLIRDIHKGMRGKRGEGAKGGEEEALPGVGGQHGQTSCAHLVVTFKYFMLIIFDIF
jgi:hypothetical protein